MTKLTSRYTRFFKVVFPAFWFGFLAIFVLAAALGGATAEAPAIVFPPLVMAVFGFFIFKHILWDLVDEVYDCGDSLLVKNRGQEERIALSNVINVNASTFINPPRVTLKLAIPSIFGSEVTFTPVQRFSLNPFAKNELIEQLIVRVDQARSRRTA